MVDSEQLRFQPAIDNIAMQLSCEYNKMHRNPYNPIVLNTHQIYLKDGANNWRQGSHLPGNWSVLHATSLLQYNKFHILFVTY